MTANEQTIADILARLSEPATAGNVRAIALASGYAVPSRTTCQRILDRMVRDGRAIAFERKINVNGFEKPARHYWRGDRRSA